MNVNNGFENWDELTSGIGKEIRCKRVGKGVMGYKKDPHNKNFKKLAIKMLTKCK